jgi:hypothetical protein
MDRRALSIFFGAVAGVLCFSPATFAANDVNAALAERLKANGLIVMVPAAGTSASRKPLKDRLFTVRGTYRGVRGVQGHVRVGPPEPPDTCGPLVTASVIQSSARTSSRGSLRVNRTSKHDLSSAQPLSAEYTVATLVRDGTAPMVSTRPRLVSLARPSLRGTDVAAIQRALNEFGESLIVDGSFGPDTDAAVRRYKSANDLEADGIVGNRTRRSLGIRI